MRRPDILGTPYRSILTSWRGDSTGVSPFGGIIKIAMALHEAGTGKSEHEQQPWPHWHPCPGRDFSLTGPTSKFFIETPCPLARTSIRLQMRMLPSPAIARRVFFTVSMGPGNFTTMPRLLTLQSGRGPMSPTGLILRCQASWRCRVTDTRTIPISTFPFRSLRRMSRI